MAKILGNKEWTWDDVNCEHLDKDHNCIVASRMARKSVKTNPYSCSVCLERPDQKTEMCPAIQNLVVLQKRKEQENKIVTIEDRLGGGVGTELHKVIPSFLDRSGCSCKSYAKKMNIWGPALCERNREAIIHHLLTESAKQPIFGWIPSSTTKIVANKLLTTAINRAREKEEPLHVNNKWFCAVATAPRKIPTVQTCLESMRVAGFDPFVFAEPGSAVLPPEFKETTITHQKKLGVWHNWLFSLRYALENSDANIIMTVQDDSLFHPDSKQFTESFLWPHDKVGFVSLYTPKHYNKKPNQKTALRSCGINRVITKSLWGACALVWPRKVVEEMLEQGLTKTWLGAPTKTPNSTVMQKRKADSSLVQNSDTAIGKLMNRMGRTMWFMDPSPVNHFATTSAANHGGNLGRRNCGRCAKWSESLSDQIPLLTNGKELPPRVDYDNILM